MRGHLGFIPLLALLVGCAAVPEPETPASTEMLDRQWRLHAYQRPGEMREADIQAPFILRIAADGDAGGQVACNRWFSRARFPEPDRLRLEAIGSTRMYCPLDDPRERALESRFGSLLSDEAVRWEVENGELVLQFGDGERWWMRPESRER